MATTFETTHTARSSVMERFAGWATRATREVQVSRMSEALAHLSDAHLARLNLTRADIPAKAREIVFQGR